MKTHVGQSYAWADRNGDGLTQPEELSFGPGDPKQRPFRHYYWGVLPDTDGTLAFVGSDGQSLVKFPIRSFTACGAPVYDVANPQVVQFEPKLAPEPSRDRQGAAKRPLANARGSAAARATSSAAATAACTSTATRSAPWTRAGRSCSPTPAATCRSTAPILAEPRPSGSGLLLAAGGEDRSLTVAAPPSSILGTADLGGEIGEVFDLNGNLGENYLFTWDGLWIQALFKDTRGWFEIPGQAVRGMSFDATTAGGESFGGNFVRTKDGKVYLTIGGTDARVLQVAGLDTIQRFDGTLTYTARQYAEAQRLATERAAKANEPKVAKIARAAAPPKLDGKADGWPELLDESKPAILIQESAQRRYARVAARYDAENLYVAWRVFGPAGRIRNAGQDERLLFIPSPLGRGRG